MDTELLTSDSSPGRGLMLAALAAIVLMAGFFVALGNRSDPPEPPPPTAAPTPTPSNSIEAAIGPWSVVDSVRFDNGSTAVIACSATNWDQLLFVQLAPGERIEDPTAVVTHRAAIARPKALDNCLGCSIKQLQLAETNEPLLTGSCVVGPANGANTSFVVAPPVGSNGSALALVVDCGVSRLVEQDQGFELITRPTLGSDDQPDRFPVSLARTAAGFEPSSAALLNEYCDTSGSAQLDLG